MKNFLLFTISVVLFTILAPLGLITELIKVLSKGFNNFFLKIAISIDQLGNVVCQTLFNLTLIKKDEYYSFGNPDQKRMTG